MNQSWETNYRCVLQEANPARRWGPALGAGQCPHLPGPPWEQRLQPRNPPTPVTAAQLQLAASRGTFPRDTSSAQPLPRGDGASPLYVPVDVLIP